MHKTELVKFVLLAPDNIANGKHQGGKYAKKQKVTVQSCVKENERMAAVGRYRRELPPIIIRLSFV